MRSQHQKNFQLIVISHDEKFLFKLAELNSNKGFYQLYRKQTYVYNKYIHVHILLYFACSIVIYIFLAVTQQLDIV